MGYLYLGKRDLGRVTSDGDVDYQDKVRVNVLVDGQPTGEREISVDLFVHSPEFAFLGDLDARREIVKQMSWLPSQNRPAAGSHPISNSVERFTSVIRSWAKE
jgi:hypothetical protein